LALWFVYRSLAAARKSATARIGVSQQSRQRGLAVQEWEIAQFLAIMLDKVEGVE
jgi:hypothetical protein